MWCRAVRVESPIHIDVPCPVECTHSAARVQWCCGKKPLVSHPGYSRHLPERTGHRGISTLKKHLSVITPRAIDETVQRAGPHSVLCCTHNDIFLPVGFKVKRITEVVAQPLRTTVDDDTLLVPFRQVLINRLSLDDTRSGIVNTCIDDIRFSIDQHQCTAPATFQIVVLTRCNGNPLLRPVGEVLTREMSPV